MSYFLLRQSEDGYLHVSEESDRSLRRMLANSEEEFSDGFFEALPRMDDGCFVGTGTLIIKGEIVIPKPKTVVKDYDL